MNFPIKIPEIPSIAEPLNMQEFQEFPFTPKNIAVMELKRRRKKVTLTELVRFNVHDSIIPIPKRERPYAVFFRQVATPTHETLRFLQMTKNLPLQPLILEYYGDKFVSAGNPYKRSLGKMPIYKYTGNDGRDMVEYKTVFDLNKYTGKELGAIHCTNGEKLVDFHHRLLKGVTKINMETLCYDATEWFSRHGDKANLYYEDFLSFFIRDGILFEDFEPTQSEGRFVREIMLPAFCAVELKYGLTPLVVELIPKNEGARAFWNAYPKKIQRLISEK